MLLMGTMTTKRKHASKEGRWRVYALKHPTDLEGQPGCSPAGGDLAWISTVTNSPNTGDGIPWCFFCPAPPLRPRLPL